MFELARDRRTGKACHAISRGEILGVCRLRIVIAREDEASIYSRLAEVSICSWSDCT